MRTKRFFALFLAFLLCLSLLPTAARADGVYTVTATGCKVSTTADYDTPVTEAAPGTELGVSVDFDHVPQGKYIRLTDNMLPLVTLTGASWEDPAAYTFVMPENNVTAAVEYADQQALSVDLSSGSASMPAKAVDMLFETDGVRIEYNAADKKYTMDLNGDNSFDISCQMPENGGSTALVAALSGAAALGATYTIDYSDAHMEIGSITFRFAAPTTYAVTVISGTGSGDYAADATVTIKADAAAAGTMFDKWTSDDGVSFADASAAETSFKMPAKAVTVTATYQPVPPAGITWTLENGVLTISGQGAMEDYGRGAAPWFARRAEIEYVTIGPDVSHIGNYAFYACGTLHRVTIGGSGVSVGDRAFSYCCALFSVVPENSDSIASVGEGAFYACFRLLDRSFADSATVGNKAFELCGLGGMA